MKNNNSNNNFIKLRDPLLHLESKHLIYIMHNT